MCARRPGRSAATAAARCAAAGAAPARCSRPAAHAGVTVRRGALGCVWRRCARTSEGMRTIASLETPISSLVVSPDGSMVITGSSNGISFIDVVSGNRRVVSLDDDVRRLAWGPDGLLAGTSSGEVWTVGRRAERLVEALDEEISGIAVTGDGRIAVCGGEPFSVATFGRYGNEEWRGEPYKWPYCVRFSADGKQLAIATWDGQLFVLETGDLPDELGDVDTEYAGGPIFDVQFLPDRNVLVAGA